MMWSKRRSTFPTFNIFVIPSLLVSGICFVAGESLGTELLYPRETIFEEVSDYAYYCTIQFHQSAIIRGELYIIGGTVSYTTNTTTGDRGFIPNTYQRSISVQDAFNPLSNDSENNDAMKSFFNTEALPAEMPELSEGYFWVDESSAYLVSGHTESIAVVPNSTAPEKNRVWSYDISGAETNLSKAWTSFAITPEDGAAIRGFQQGGVFVPGIRQGFLLGGMISRDSDPDVNLVVNAQVAISGLLTFDAATRTWKNETTPSTITPRRRSRMFAVPYGEKGVILTLGGSGISPFLFSSIDVYDIESKQWYTQSATGTIPDLRKDFCGVVVSSTDGLSHQIFIFGGEEDGNLLSDIHVLSIPTFEWFSISSTGYGSPGARQGSTCDLYGKRHMLVFGGQKTDTSCDATGLFLFDLTKLQWETEYPELLDYEVSSPVKRSIGTGNSTRVEPENGFSNDQLSALFSKSATATATATATVSTTAGSEVSQTGTPEASKSSTGAIAGGVVGGVVAIALLATVVVYFMRWRKKEETQSEWKDEHARHELDPDAIFHQELNPDATLHELDGQKNNGVNGVGHHSFGRAANGYSNEPVELRA